MTTSKKLNANGYQLCTQLTAIKKEQSVEYVGQTINVAGVGRVVSAAYEQLRNAAEYAQEHLLIQNAIRRFFVRNLSFINHGSVAKTLAEELIIELTQSGYIANNTKPVKIVDQLSDVIKKHYDNYWRLKAAGITEQKAHNWTLDLLSIESEDILVDSSTQTAYLQFAYHHYKSILRKKSFAKTESEQAGFEVSLYVAVHRSLLESDIAAVRYDMQKLYGNSDSNINKYSMFHENIDDVFSSAMTNKIVRYINRYGAPLRILRSMIARNEKVTDLLPDSVRFETAYADQINKEYHSAETKLNRGLIKSIIFIFITKTLIGVGIEVPYDLLTTGSVLITPLAINLLTPVVYMALLRFGFKLPGEDNAKSIQQYTNDMLYGDQDQASLYHMPKEKSYPIGFSIAYALLFLVVFGCVSYMLAIWGFNIVQGLIFFIFLAAASFLGFRLSRIVKELELVVSKPGTIATIRDLLFTPFTFLGKWVSEKYQKVNVVALVLDTFIELPLKTVLRLLRQLTGFIDDKKEEI